MVSSRKTFVIAVNPRDVMVDMKGVGDKATKAFLHFWMLHSLHGEPLPPREEKVPRDEWDRWFRDRLDMKNVRTWLNAREELLRLGKIRQTEDGRLYIGRTMRDAEKRRGGDPSKWGGNSDQGQLCLEGKHWSQDADERCARKLDAQPVVDKPVESVGEDAASPEVRAMIGQSSREVRLICLPNLLILRKSRPALSDSNSNSHEVVAVIIGDAARGRPMSRGDPPEIRA